MASRCLMTDALPPDQESADQALRLLLLAIAGPNYAGALKEGNVAQQIDRCLTWVKEEASKDVPLV